jgi:Uma2 family endonuclease
MRVRIGDDVVYYPDVQVVCDPADTEQMYTTSPCVVVEVLSPSTASIDLREKVLAYRRIESLQAYVIVYRDERRVMRHYRDGGTWWDAELSGEGIVPFPCPELELTLAEIYRGLAPAG